LLFATPCSPFAPDTACFVSLSFAGLVVLARSLNPIPSRTRPLNSSAPMVLWLKPWESRSLPGLPRTSNSSFLVYVIEKKRRVPPGRGVFLYPSLGCEPVELFRPLFRARVSTFRLLVLKIQTAFAGLVSSLASQLLIHPDLTPTRPDPKPRRIQCVRSFAPSSPP
jgi:hypothetical protein